MKPAKEAQSYSSSSLRRDGKKLIVIGHLEKWLLALRDGCFKNWEWNNKAKLLQKAKRCP